MSQYDVAYNDFSPPYRPRDHIVPDYARVAQDVPTPIQAHVTPPASVCAELTQMHSFI